MLESTKSRFCKSRRLAFELVRKVSSLGCAVRRFFRLLNFVPTWFEQTYGYLPEYAIQVHDAHFELLMPAANWRTTKSASNFAKEILH
jgi:hypothetical protein